MSRRAWHDQISDVLRPGHDPTRLKAKPGYALITMIIAIVGVGGAKLVYDYLADRASLVFKNTRAIRGINILAACVMIAVGLALLLKTQEWI